MMTADAIDYDKEIESYREKIQELEQQKEQHKKKLEGLTVFAQTLGDIQEEYSLSEEEMFASQAEVLVSLMQQESKLEQPSEWFNRIEKLLGASKSSAKKRAKAKTPVDTGPKLEVGHYINPYTGGHIEKKKRNPKILNQWVEEYGFEAVSGWKQ